MGRFTFRFWRLRLRRGRSTRLRWGRRYLWNAPGRIWFCISCLASSFRLLFCFWLAISGLSWFRSCGRGRPMSAWIAGFSRRVLLWCHSGSIRCGISRSKRPGRISPSSWMCRSRRAPSRQPLSSCGDYLYQTIIVKQYIHWNTWKKFAFRKVYSNHYGFWLCLSPYANLSKSIFWVLSWTST